MYKIGIINKIKLKISEEKWRKLFINIMSLFSVQIANYILPLITIPYISRIIGPERLGLLNFSSSYNHYFVLFINFGFDLSIVRLIAANRYNKFYINKLFNEVITAKIILLLISILVFLIITLNNPVFKKDIILHSFTCFYCFGVTLFPVWLYQGMEDLSKVALLNFISKIFFTIGVLIFIHKPDDYIYQNLSLSLAHFILSIIAIRLAIKKYGLIYILPKWYEIKHRFHSSYKLFLSTVATSLYSSSQIFILGLISTSYSVGVFSAASRVESIVRVFIYMGLNQALFPLIANAFGQSTQKGLYIINRLSPILVMATLLISIALFISAPILIKFLYGNKFLEAIKILRIISALPVLLSLNSLLGLHTMLNLNMDKAYVLITIIMASIGPIINIFIIINYGLIGAAWSWLFVESLAVSIFFIYLKSKNIEIISLKNFNFLFSRLVNQ